jgi:DNA replication protein DnaC
MAKYLKQYEGIEVSHVFVADLWHEYGRLLVVDEVGYIPFEGEAANLFSQLVSSRYERASLIVTSNKVFGRWGEVFGDDVVAAAMIDRLVHHAEALALKGDSYRLKDRDLGRVPPTTGEEGHHHA